MSPTQTDRYKRQAWDVFKVLLGISWPILLGVSGWTFAQLWNHENRLTVLEVRSEAIVEDLQEIKSDVKALLRAR